MATKKTSSKKKTTPASTTKTKSKPKSKPKANGSDRLKKVVMGAIFGGIAVFFWGFLSWMALPFHSMVMHGFETSETTVAQVLKTHTPKAGIYLVPWQDMSKDMPAAEKNAAHEELQKKTEAGPFAFMAIAPEGIKGGMGKQLIQSLLIQMLAAALLTWLILMVGTTQFWCKVKIITLAAAAGTVICQLPYWNWFAFPCGWIAVAMFDAIVGWFLGGMVIAKVTEK